MKSLQQVQTLCEEHPGACQLNPPVSSSQLDEVQSALGRPLASVDPDWLALLEFTNGLQVLDYTFYPASQGTINTISFKTLFFWEINDAWEDRMFGFMGIGGILECALWRSSSGAVCVQLIRETGYESDEVIPVASGLDLFLSNFVAQCRETLSTRPSPVKRLPSLETWPPDLEAWYARDPRLVQRLQSEDSARECMVSEKYRTLIGETCRLVGG